MEIYTEEKPRKTNGMPLTHGKIGRTKKGLPEIAWGKKDAIRIDPESGGGEIQHVPMKVDCRNEALLVSKAVARFLILWILEFNPSAMALVNGCTRSVRGFSFFRDSCVSPRPSLLMGVESWHTFCPMEKLEKANLFVLIINTNNYIFIEISMFLFHY